MDLAEARLILQSVQQDLQRCFGALAALEHETNEATRRLIGLLREAEDVLRGCLGAVHAVIGAGINPEGMGMLATSLATALENTDRVRDLIMGLTGIKDAVERVHANTSTANYRINEELG